MIEAALLVAVLVVSGAILVAVKFGFNEVIKALQAIHDKLDDRSS